jgi:hypothetical protein
VARSAVAADARRNDYSVQGPTSIFLAPEIQAAMAEGLRKAGLPEE